MKNSLRTRFVQMLTPVVACVMLAMMAPTVSHAETITYSDQVWDFGHVGIDFKVYHSYWIANNGDKPVKIEDIIVTCECSQVLGSDTVIAPGDTARFKLTFETKNYYGAVNRSFVVVLDSDEVPELQFHYLATVGQWFYGIKPDPISLFFLPAHKSRRLTVTNTSFDKIEASIVELSDESIEAKVIADKATKGKAIEIEIQPSDEIGAGTYKSSITIAVLTNQSDKPALLTIPVKIVRY